MQSIHEERAICHCNIRRSLCIRRALQGIRWCHGDKLISWQSPVEDERSQSHLRIGALGFLTRLVINASFSAGSFVKTCEVLARIPVQGSYDPALDASGGGVRDWGASLITPLVIRCRTWSYAGPCRPLCRETSRFSAFFSLHDSTANVLQVKLQDVLEYGSRSHLDLVDARETISARRPSRQDEDWLFSIDRLFDQPG